jgi:hypothetical protein
MIRVPLALPVLIGPGISVMAFSNFIKKPKFLIPAILLLGILSFIGYYQYEKAKYEDISTVVELPLQDFKKIFQFDHFNFYDYIGSDEKYDYFLNCRFRFMPYQRYYKVIKGDVILFERFKLFEKESYHLNYGIFEEYQTKPMQ